MLSISSNTVILPPTIKMCGVIVEYHNSRWEHHCKCALKYICKFYYKTTKSTLVTMVMTLP